MRVIIAGSRTLGLHEVTAAVAQALKENKHWTINEVVSGAARGVDKAGEDWARMTGRIPVKRFPADWDTHGKSAGPIRNRQMAEYADALIAVWDGKSRGTRHMIQVAKELGLEVHVHIVKPETEEPTPQISLL